MQHHEDDHGESYEESNLERESIGEEGRDGVRGRGKEKEGEGKCGWGRCIRCYYYNSLS